MGRRSREKLTRRLASQSPEAEEGREKSKFQPQTGLEKTCLFIIKWGTYLVLFAPLIILTQFFFPFVAPKTTIFRILVEIIFVAYLFLAISHSQYRPKINTLTIALTLFLAVFILASFTGINLERSFWSTYERMTGIWTMLHLYTFFIVLTCSFKERKDWEKFLGVSVLVGVFLSLYVLKGSEISTRGGGTIGNTSFMAAYLLFSIFFAIILFLAKRGVFQIFSGISLLIMLPVLFTSNARGAIISFLVGIFLLGMGYLIFSQKKVLKRMALGIILVLVVLGIIFAIFQPAFVKGPVEHTLREMKSRFVVWEKGWKGFLERPILGWGPENFNVVFLKYFNPCVFLSECGGEIWFDRVHNIVFDTLATMGIVGLLSYLAIFAVAIFGILRILPKIVEKKNIFFPLGMVVLLLVYFGQNLLVFDMINSYLMFFLSLAFIGFLIEKKREEVVVRAKPVNSLLGAAIIIITIFFLWSGNIQPLMAGHYIVKAIGAQETEDSTKFFQKSLNSWMNKYETREQFAQRIMREVFGQGQRSSALLKAIEASEAEMEKSVKENSLDFRPHLFLGRLYMVSYQVTGDETKVSLAEKTLEKAIEFSPTNQQGYWYLGEVRLVQKKSADAIALFQKAVELEPRFLVSHWYLAMVYKAAGYHQLAKDKVLEAENLGYYWKGKLSDLQRVIEIYLALNDDSGLVPLYLKAIELDPKNPQFWASLAASYANLGQYEKAREAVKMVQELNPNLQSQTEEFLKNLPKEE